MNIEGLNSLENTVSHLYRYFFFFLLIGVIQSTFGQNNQLRLVDEVKSSSTLNDGLVLPNGYKIFRKNNKYGISNATDEVVIMARYDKISWSDKSKDLVEDFIGYKSNDLWGAVNLKSKKIIGAKYTGLKPHQENQLIVSKKNPNNIQRVFGLINTNEKILISLKYNSLSSANSLLIASKYVEDKNVYGLIDNKEKIIIPFIYQKIKHLSKALIAVKNKEDKYALFTVEGVALSGFTYDDISRLKNGWFTISSKGKKGILDKNGKVLVQPEYKKITVEGHNIQALPFPSWEVLNANNTLLKQFAYDTVTAINSSLLKAKIGDNAYIIDFNNNPITLLKRRSYGDFKAGYAVIKENDKFGVLGNYNDVVIPIKFDSIIHYNELFVVYKQESRDHKWMVYNQNGTKINQLYYDQIGGYSEQFFSVKKNGVWGFINQFGHEVIKAKYDSVYDFKNGVAKVKLKGNYGVIDKFGRTVLPTRYKAIIPLSGEVFVVKNLTKAGIFVRFKGEVYQTYDKLSVEKGFIVEKTHAGKFGLFDPNGQRILTSKYDQIKIGVSDRIHVYSLENDFGILNKRGGTILGLNNGLQDVGLVHEDFIQVKIHGKYGFIDFNGKLRIANRYDKIGVFTEEMAPIHLLGKWGYIDRIERIKIQPQFDEVSSFNSSTAIVRKGKYFGLINKEGKTILNISYDKIERNNFGNYLTSKGGKTGFVNNQGYEIIFPKFDHIEDLGDGNMIIENNGKFGLINEKGVSTIPLAYKHLIFHPASKHFFGMNVLNWKNIQL